MGYLEKASAFITNLGYKVSRRIEDDKRCLFGFLVTFNKKRYYLLAVKDFHHLEGVGICKSIDVGIVDWAREKGSYILLYVNEPAPSCYQINPDNIWAIRDSLGREKFSATWRGEERWKYKNVPLARIGMRNIRGDMAREMNNGEKLWAQDLKELGFIYIGDQHGDFVYRKSIGFCPDFVHLLTNVIIEEGWHNKDEVNRRKALAEQHNMLLYFIPHDFEFYRRNPEAVQGVLGIIKELVKT